MKQRGEEGGEEEFGRGGDAGSYSLLFRADGGLFFVFLCFFI